LTESADSNSTLAHPFGIIIGVEGGDIGLGEMQKKKTLQGTPKTTSGRVLSNPVSPHLSFAAALQGQGNHQPHEEALANSNPEATATKTSPPEVSCLKAKWHFPAPDEMNILSWLPKSPIPKGSDKTLTDEGTNCFEQTFS
jgi:hypothetical protein